MSRTSPKSIYSEKFRNAMRPRRRLPPRRTTDTHRAAERETLRSPWRAGDRVALESPTPSLSDDATRRAFAVLQNAGPRRKTELGSIAKTVVPQIQAIVHAFRVSFDGGHSAGQAKAERERGGEYETKTFHGDPSLVETMVGRFDRRPQPVYGIVSARRAHNARLSD